MHFLYNIFALLLVVLAIPVFIVRLIREKGFGERIRQSCGVLPADVLQRVSNRDCIWLHAASVGEIVATSPIVKEIKREFPDNPILISVVTASGYEMAKRIITEAEGIIFFPLDLPWLALNAVKRIKPRVFLPVETELWPNFLRAVRNYNIPVMMVNGRISDKSVKRYTYLHTVLQDMLSTVSRFCMQSQVDAEYIIRLGADSSRVEITGNTKFDQTYTDVTAEEKNILARQLGVADSYPVLIAGSTHKGEEESLLRTMQAVQQKYPQGKIIIAPRDIMRVDELAAMAQGMGFATARRTQLQAAELPGDSPTVIFLDTIGELGKVYAFGDIIYVGGSLIRHGGHNVLEPAAHGKPIIVGPHMFNFKDSYALLSGRGACVTANDDRELTAQVLSILADDSVRRHMGEQSLAIIMENRGAARKSVVALKNLLNSMEKAI